MNKLDKYQKMFEMRQAGKTYEEIGNQFGMTRKGSYWILSTYFPLIKKVKFPVYVNRKCLICGKKYKRLLSQSLGKKYFCSRDCYSKSAMPTEEFRQRKREYMKRYILSDKGKGVIKRLRINSYEKFKYKALARAALHRAIRQGKIKRQTKCFKCLNDTRRIEAHHDDYGKPLEVVWLCSVCHAAKHKKHDKIKKGNLFLHKF